MIESYVDEVDVCDIPKGKHDTRGFAVWALYRERLHRGDIAKNPDQDRRKTVEKHEHMHE